MQQTEFVLLSKIGEMREQNVPTEDILVFMIQHQIKRVCFTDGTIFDPDMRVLH